MTALPPDVLADLNQLVAELEQRLESSFAAHDAAIAQQAATAQENARLQAELADARNRETAGAEILRTIADTHGDAEHALQRIAETTQHFFDAASVTIRIAEGDEWVQTIRVGPSSHLTGSQPASNLTVRGANLPATVYRDNRQIHMPDLDNVDPSMAHWPAAAARAAGIRTTCGSPLRRGEQAIGALIVYRDHLAPFTDGELALQQTFADQAAIAIQNARLFTEMSEALERQTATSEILKVIASSPADTQPVFEAIARSTKRLLGGFSCAVWRFVEGQVHLAAYTPTTPAADAALRADFPQPVENFEAFGLAQGGKPFPIPDTEEIGHAPLRDIARLHGFRSVTFMPLMNNGVPIGIIAPTRAQPGALAPHHLQLLQTFADQAVIAIENVRLFDEVQAKTRDLSEALTYQTGSGNILKVIASSPTEVGPVLRAIADNACEVCDAYDAAVLLRDGDELRFSAHHGPIPIGIEKWPINRHWTAGRAVVDKQAVHLHDLLAEENADFSDGRELSRRMGHRSILSVPLMRENEAIGAIVLRRTEVHPFSDKQIALLQTFADQAVIAIGNVRLFEEVQARTRELAASLDNLRTAQDRLVQTEKLASLGQLTAGIAHEIKNPLNFVNNFAALSAELTDELNDVLKPAALTDNIREEVNELTGLLKDNLEKVVQHGKRADSIVKNMLLHSRDGSGDHRPADINALIDESLNLAYHGARAEKPDFNVTLRRDFDPSAGTVEVFPQEITRVFLNLISNGFYAVAKRKLEGADAGFDPVLSAVTRDLGDSVEIRIRDNGTGIPPEVRDKMFNPFFTTKPAGEGTGLGLSMSHDIIVKQHGGTIDVETEPGQFTEFRIVLPRASAPPNKNRGQT